MSANFTFYLLLKGTKEEMKSALGVLREYEKNEDVNIDSFSVGKATKQGTMNASSSISISSFTSEEKIEEFINKMGKEIVVEADGPYGTFATIDEVCIFEEIAASAPSSYLDGLISGSSTGGRQYLSCKTEDGKLHICYKFESEDSDPYVDYVMEILPCAEFVSIFKVLDEEFINNYYDLIDEKFGDEEIYDMDFEEFTDEIYSEIDEEEYEQAINKVKALNIKSRAQFEKDEEEIPDSEKLYDPLTKEYLKI